MGELALPVLCCEVAWGERGDALPLAPYHLGQKSYPPGIMRVGDWALDLI